MIVTSSFDESFEALTGHPPLRWQRRLYAQHFVSGNIPASCTLPTGLGKTSVIAIWLIALPDSLGTGHPLPRRLVYIVNRRTIVDQATDVLERIREKLNSRDANGAVRGMREALRAMCADSAGEVLAASTLRGELADSGEWKKDPARPAVVIGTVDMIGSKLLFSGYGDGRYNRAHHAGLIGQDTLIIHDEAHLTPAFSNLLRLVEREQQREFQVCDKAKRVARPVRVLELSATARANDDDWPEIQSFGIEPEDAADMVVQDRVKAAKKLTINSVEKDTLARAIAEHAAKHRNAKQRVLIYVRRPDDAGDVRKTLQKELELTDEEAKHRLGLLTGTIRGYERDQLVKLPLFRAFISRENRDPLEDTLYLVSTSAGEVGVDFDADHLVCDLTTLDSMAQRFGRVNRLGGKNGNGDRREATITVVAGTVSDKDPLKAQIENTAEVLRKLPTRNGGFDASPEALTNALLDRGAAFRTDAEKAFSPTPTIVPATDILFDNWSLTSISGELPGRPQVREFLHGKVDWESPEVHVVWRADVVHLDEALNNRPSDETLEEILQSYPVKSWERLRETLQLERSTKKWVLEKLAGLADAQRGTDGSKVRAGDMPAIVVETDGSAMLTTIREAAGMDLRDRTVVLPVEAGGLSSEGTLRPSATEPARDVADERPRSSLRLKDAAAGSAEHSDASDQLSEPHAARLRVMLRRADDKWTAEYIGRPSDTDVPALPAEPTEDRGELVDKISKASGLPLKYTVQIGGNEDEEPRRFLLYFVTQRDPDAPPDFTAPRQCLDVHNKAVVSAAEQLADKLGLDDDTTRALVIAARLHDTGKLRNRWQKMVGGSLAKPLAKSGNRFVRGADLRGYRHEFGSVQDAMADPEAKQAADGVRQLVLHLIAAHHGWARPHFPHGDPPLAGSRGWQARSAYDNERYTTAQNQAAAIEVMQRFGRLQQRFGRWGLAWLESLLRSADAMASQPEQSRDREGVDANIAPQSPQEDRP